MRSDKKQAQQEEMWRALVHYLVQAQFSEKNLDAFLNKLLAPRERATLSQRLAVLSLLQSDNSYRVIQTELGISANVIRAVQKSFRRGGYTYRSWRDLKGNPSLKRNTFQEPFIFRKEDLVEILNSIFHGKTVKDLYPGRRKHRR